MFLLLLLLPHNYYYKFFLDTIIARTLSFVHRTPYIQRRAQIPKYDVEVAEMLCSKADVRPYCWNSEARGPWRDRKEDLKGFEFDWGIWTDWRWNQGCWEQRQELAASSVIRQALTRKLAFWRCMHHASSNTIYINQQDAQNSCD